MMGGGDAQKDPLLPLPLLPAGVDDASAVGDDSIMSALLSRKRGGEGGGGG